MFEQITSENFTLYASRHYDNPLGLEVNEFYDDLNRIKYIKKLFNRYEQSNDLQVRLILNHIIVLFNVFGLKASKEMLFFKIEERHYSMLKPFLIYLNYLPENEYVEVDLDRHVINQLRNL